MGNKRWCKFPSCKTTENSNLRMYRLPLNIERCKEWLKVINSPVLNEMPAEKLRSAVICELHFEDWCFKNLTSKQQLVQNAVPTVGKPIECIRDSPASIINLSIKSDQEYQSSETSDSPANISELHFKGGCAENTIMNESLSIAKNTSASKIDSNISVENTTAIGSLTKGTVQLNITQFFTTQESSTQMETPMCVSEQSMPNITFKRPCADTPTYSKEIDSSKQTTDGTPTCKDIVTACNVAIIKEDFPCEQLTNGDIAFIQAIILERIDCASSGELKPRLKTFKLDDGVLIYTCLDGASCLWLKRTLEGKIIGSGSPLQVVDPKKIPHPFKVSFNTKDAITTDSSKLLRRLQLFNSRLQVNCWKVLDWKREKFGQQFVLQVDRPSFTAIQEANFKAFTGVDEGVFTVLSSPKAIDLRFMKLSSC